MRSQTIGGIAALALLTVATVAVATNGVGAQAEPAACPLTGRCGQHTLNVGSSQFDPLRSLPPLRRNALTASSATMD